MRRTNFRFANRDNGAERMFVDVFPNKDARAKLTKAAVQHLVKDSPGGFGFPGSVK